MVFNITNYILMIEGFFCCLGFLFCCCPLGIKNLLSSCECLLLTNRLLSFSRLGFIGFVLMLVNVLFSFQNHEPLDRSGLNLLTPHLHSFQ